MLDVVDVLLCVKIFYGLLISKILGFVLVFYYVYNLVMN